MTPPSLPAVAGDQLSQELASLMDEIQRTREWFNSQIEAQLSSLNQLRTAMQVDDSICSTSMATLFEAPQPEVPALEPVLAFKGVQHQHQAIVLPPTKIVTLDPEMEQATLRELNDALAQAFSEISSRGGMLA
ncbi:MAG: hypothetical protein Q8M07_25505 [Prosthecobacter sp.]|nr:hypothetical protein [Prosthecobacter sp.]